MSNITPEQLRRLELACVRLDGIWAMEDSLHAFVKGAWPIISGGYTFQDSWAVRAICEHLMAVENGQIKRLLINLPPRTGKSLICSVAFPVWCWLRNPMLNVMNVAYIDDLSQRDNVKSRRLIQSGWFQGNWGPDRVRLASDQNTKDRMTTTAGGDRLAMSMMGGILGDGADVIICLPHSTLLETSRGFLPIGLIVEDKIDCLIMSSCMDTGAKEYKAIEAYEKNLGRELWEMKLNDGSVVQATAEHPVWIEGRGYVAIESVEVGDEAFVRGESGAVRFPKVESIGRTGVTPEWVYNVRVAGNHNYFANGVLLHNCDDPNSVSQRSKTILDRTNEIFSVTLPTRFNDMKTGRQVVIQQRVHENDVSGFILSEEKHDYVHLMLPMEFEPERACSTVVLPSTSPDVWRDPRTEAGELLIPDRVGVVELDRLKRALRQTGGEYEVAGQLQQRPAPAEGGIVKRAWFKRWTDAAPPDCDMVVQVWDTAVSEKKEAAFSACQTWGLFDTEGGRGAILLAAYRDRMEFPKLYATVKMMGNDYRIKTVSKTDEGGWTADRLPDGTCVPDVIIIEAKSSGQSLLQSIRRLDFPKASVIGFNPTKYGDKVSRMRKVTHLVEGGMVYLPEKIGAPGVLRAHAKEFEDEIAVFPQGTSKDVGDVFSMALTWLMERGLLSSSLETISYVTEVDERDTVAREQAIY